MERAVRVLAVDDEPSVTLSLGYILDRPRYETVAVSDGDAALTKLDTDPVPFDIIIVDQIMPHLSGIKLVQEIRKRGIPGKIILISAHLSAEICASYEGENVQVLLNKPFDVEILRRTVDRLMRES